MDKKIIKHLLTGIIILLSIPQISYAQFESTDTLTKEVDVCMSVINTEQDYNYWCVYACLEAIRNGSAEQCQHCYDYIRLFIESLSSNPYPAGNFSPGRYDEAMKHFKNDNDPTCSGAYTYLFEPFGVLDSDLTNFMENRDLENISPSTFYSDITDPNKDVSSPFLLVSRSGNVQHCVVYLGSVLYNNDWFHEKSKIYIMDPKNGYQKDITYNEFTSNYEYVFQ